MLVPRVSYARYRLTLGKSAGNPAFGTKTCPCPAAFQGSECCHCARGCLTPSLSPPPRPTKYSESTLSAARVISSAARSSCHRETASHYYLFLLICFVFLFFLNPFQDLWGHFVQCITHAPSQPTLPRAQSCRGYSGSALLRVSV